MKKARRHLEQLYGDRISEATGITPIITQMIKLDKIPVLRYLVLSRKVLFKLIVHAENASEKTDSGIRSSELIQIINGMLFNDVDYISIRFNKNRREIEGLISVMNNTIFSLILDKLELPGNKRVELQRDLEKAFRTILTVYGPLTGESLSKETTNILELFALELPEMKDAELISSKDELEGSLTIEEQNPDVDQVSDDNIVDELAKSKKDEMKLLSRQETADIFNISLPTLKTWEKKGTIPKAIRIGGRVYFNESKINALINAAKDGEH